MKRLPIAIIVLVVSLALCALLLSGCGGGKQDPAGQGKVIYEAQDCKTCHMLGGAGAKGPGPDLSHVGSKLTADEIRMQITDPQKVNASNTMPAHTGIPKPDLDKLVAYLEGLK